jgi:capsular exopolysaccharide synthesis family protein
LRKSWYVIVAAALVGLVIAFAYAHRLPDSYRSTGSIFVSTTQGASTSDLSSGSTFTRNTVASYATLATTPAVLTPVIGELGLTTTPVKLARQISAVSPLNTVFVQITVTDGSASRSAAIANAVTRSLRTVATDLAPQTASGRSSITMSIVTTAQAPTSPVGPNRHLMDIIGLLVGLVVGILLALLRASLDTRIRSARDVERVTDAPVVGTIRRGHRADGATVALLAEPDSAVAEDFRRLRATLQFAGPNGAVSSVLVTSPMHASEATSVAVNAALAVAERGKRALVIDADLRNPAVQTLTGVDDARGLTDVLEGSISLQQAVQAWQPNVDVLTTGPTPSNPHFLLGSTGLADLVDEARSSYDLVVVVAAPVLAYSDALALVQSTEGALIVSPAKRSTRPQLRKTMASLASVQADVIGVVLTRVNAQEGTGRPAGPVAPRPSAPAPRAAEASGNHRSVTSDEQRALR